ncbi:hypothetical protein QUA27_10825 [Microcoleus sp. Pol14C6]|uniref:hypothetical protein n=1 Tax=unclassified Microcoleus TaxID=2642155 RepID=UPI003B1F8AF4
MQATPRLSYRVVCAPRQRYHPGIIAQAAATLVEMFPNSFWLTVGSGRALNENITGDNWPTKSATHASKNVSILSAPFGLEKPSPIAV